MKKGNTGHFGYEAHIGIDKDTGLVHHVEVTRANVHDVTVVPQLLTEEETVVYGGSGYLGAEKHEGAVTQNKQGMSAPVIKCKRIRYKTSRRPSQSRNRSVRSRVQIKRRMHEKSSVRAKVEHVFTVWSRDCFISEKCDIKVCKNRQKS